MTDQLTTNEELEIAISERWDGQNEGYAPIYIVGPLISVSLAPRKKQTAVSALEVVHYPALESNGTRTGLALNEKSRCMKLDAIVEMLHQIKNKLCNLDLAIVTSCRDLEEVIAVRLSNYDFQFQTLTNFHRPRQAPIFGVLVRFRKKPNLPVHFRLRVDFVVVYDSSLIEDRASISQHFQGVYYDTPQSVAFTCISTCDNRVCNYRDKHPDMKLDSKTLIRDLSPDEKVLFTKSRHKIAYRSRVIHNNYIITRLVDWMVLKDGSLFNPIDVTSYEYAFGGTEVPPILGERNLPQSQPLSIGGAPKSLKRISEGVDTPEETSASKRSKFGITASKSTGNMVLTEEVSQRLTMLSQSTLDNTDSGSSGSSSSGMDLQSPAPISNASSRVLEDLSVRTPLDPTSSNTSIGISPSASLKQKSRACPYQLDGNTPHPDTSSSSLSISSSTAHDQITQSQDNAQKEKSSKPEEKLYNDIYNDMADFERALEMAHRELIRALNGD